eukprot:3111525-Pyramimonas_sp.AAC.1
MPCCCGIAPGRGIPCMYVCSPPCVCGVIPCCGIIPAGGAPCMCPGMCAPAGAITATPPGIPP